MDKEIPEPIVNNKTARGRGTVLNPTNRFEEIKVEPDPEYDFSEDPQPKTTYYLDSSKSFITYNDSPDISFSAGINPYRGCEHGCIYCYARPSHEYFGLSSGLDFETKIFVKMNAPELLRKEFLSSKWKPQVIALSGNTDCYQPAEKRLKITRQILEVLLEFRNPAGMITKNKLITRDLDILSEMAKLDLVSVSISVTSLDRLLARKMEPRASTPNDRLEAIEKLAKANIPVGVMVAPIVPGLTDHEIPAILEECKKRGARHAGYTVLRLPYSIKELFEDWLIKNFPERKDKILNRIKSLRGGKLNDPNFGSRMHGIGIFADQIDAIFNLYCKKFKLNEDDRELTTKYFRKKDPKQFDLFNE
jgi:DNA repair photolyase